MSIYLGNSERLTRNELADIETPAPTATWKPVSHADVVNNILHQADARGYEVVKETYGVNTEGKKLFGLIEFAPHGHPEWTRCLGINNSHDKSLSVRVAVGVSVMVCDNLCLSGDMVCRRKHTSGLSLYEHIEMIMEGMNRSFASLEMRFEEMKRTPFGWGMAKRDAVELAQNHVINSSSIVPIIDEFENPRHEEFTDPTEWNYYMAITETIKSYPVQGAMQAHRGLAERFGLK